MQNWHFRSLSPHPWWQHLSPVQGALLQRYSVFQQQLPPQLYFCRQHVTPACARGEGAGAVLRAAIRAVQDPGSFHLPFLPPSSTWSTPPYPLKPWEQEAQPRVSALLVLASIICRPVPRGETCEWETGNVLASAWA